MAGIGQPLAFQPFLQLDRIVEVGLDFRARILGRDQQRTVESKRLLAIRMVVAVIEIRTALPDGEFVSVRSAWRHRLLGDFRRAVHFVRKDQPVPMNGRGFRKRVMEVDADVITLGHLKSRSGHLAIVGISLDREVWQNVPLDDGSFDIEYLDPVFDARFEHTIAPCIGRRFVEDLSRLDRRHVLHGLSRKIESVDHARRHDGAVDVAGAQTQVHRKSRHHHSGDQKKRSHPGQRDQLRDGGLVAHPVIAPTLDSAAMMSRITVSMLMRLRGPGGLASGPLGH